MNELSLFESIDLPLVIFDNQKAYYINTAGKKLLKFSKNENISKIKPLSFINDKYRNRIKENNTRIINGEKFPSVELEITNKKGNTIDIQAKSTQFVWEGKKVVLSMFYDITEKKQLYRNLIESQNILNVIGKSDSDFIFRYELSEKPTLSYVSNSVFSVTGIKKTQLQKNHQLFFSKIYCEGGPNYSFNTAHLKRLSKNSTQIVDYNVPGRESKILSINHQLIKNEKGKTVSVLALVRDITKESQAESALHLSQKQFNIITKNAHDIIYFFTYQPKPKYLFVSDSLKKVLGYSPQQLYKDLFSLIRKVWEKIIL